MPWHEIKVELAGKGEQVWGLAHTKIGKTLDEKN